MLDELIQFNFVYLTTLSHLNALKKFTGQYFKEFILVWFLGTAGTVSSLSSGSSLLDFNDLSVFYV